MVPHFKELFGDKFDYRDKALVYENWTNNQHFPIKQTFVWLMSYLNMPINEYDTDPIKAAAIGYVMNDDAISYIDEIRGLWNSFNAFCDHKVDIIFPTMKMKKNDVWESSPKFIQNNVTWCEGFYSEDRCGDCHSCKRMKDEIPHLYWKPDQITEIVKAAENVVAMIDEPLQLELVL
jgi:hypothetical protein